MIHRLCACFALLLVLAPLSAAHDTPGSTNYELLVPPGPYSGQITFVTLVGPPAGSEVLHTTWNITFESPPGGTPASDVLMELTFQQTTGSVFWLVSGADFGWPSDTGTFSGSITNEIGPEPTRTSKYTPGKELSYNTGPGGPSISLESFSGAIKLMTR